MKVIGIDPGKTTGIALCCGSAADFVIMQTAEINGVQALEEKYGEAAAADDAAWRWLEYYNALECYAWIDDALSSLKGDETLLVVIEDFILQPGKSGEYRGGARAGLSPARVGACIGMMLEVGGDQCSIMWQNSSMISRMGKLRMERLGLWVRGSEHKRDAVRHAYVGWQRSQQQAVARSVAVAQSAAKSGGATVKKAVGARKVRASKAASAHQPVAKVARKSTKVGRRVRKGS